MILIDYNQVVIANLMEQIGSSKTSVEESLVRHMVLNTIRANIRKFKSEYGEVVIACDNRHYWRMKSFLLTKHTERKIEQHQDTTGIKSLNVCLIFVKN